MGWTTDVDGNVVGDEVWDIMGSALDDIEKVYQRIGLEITPEALDSIYEFVSEKYRGNRDDTF